MKKVQVTTFDSANQRLFIEVEEKLTGELWRGDFQAKYIEEISAKTGAPKKFNTFVKALLTAFKGENPSVVYIDLLTYADLEALKSQRSGSSAQSIQNPANSKKRYFIMTETLNN